MLSSGPYNGAKKKKLENYIIFWGWGDSPHVLPSAPGVRTPYIKPFCFSMSICRSVAKKVEIKYVRMKRGWCYGGGGMRG